MFIPSGLGVTQLAMRLFNNRFEILNNLAWVECINATVDYQVRRVWNESHRTEGFDIIDSATRLK